jgi:hypothetical protein
MCDQDKKDAERYRWLRANALEIVFNYGHGESMCYAPSYEKPEELDASVDAAMGHSTKP